MREIFRKASKTELKEIYLLYKECSRDLNKKNIYMWDENYPTKDLLEKEIKAGNLYIKRVDNQLVVSFVLNDYQDEVWEGVNWEEENFIGLHLLAVHPDYQKRGFGTKVLSFTDKFAKENGFESIHLDVLSINFNAVKLYQDNGYIKVGELYFDFKPKNYRKYFCYEKIL